MRIQLAILKRMVIIYTVFDWEVHKQTRPPIRGGNPNDSTDASKLEAFDLPVASSSGRLLKAEGKVKTGRRDADDRKGLTSPDAILNRWCSDNMLDLRSFLNELDEANELTHIRESLSTKLEVPAVLERLDGGSAVLFEKVKGSNAPIVGGVCGTRDRICKALKIDKDVLYPHLLAAIRNPIEAKRVEDGPVKEVVEDPRLSDIPILTHYERDSAPYLTAAVVSARSPDGKTENASIHRMMVMDDEHLAIRIVPRHLHKLCQMAREVKNTLDVSISVGLTPTILLAASSPVPFGVSEFDVANALMKGKLRLVKCEHVDAYAPADAELVLEGRILLDEETLEGPFVDITSTYDVQRMQPVVEVLGVMRREDYIYQGLLPAGSEHRLLMGMPREARIWDYSRNIVPTVKAVNMTIGGCGWLHCVVSLEKFREGDGKNILMAIFAANPSIKHAVVVDSDIDVYDMSEVEWAIATRFRGDRDLMVVPNVRVSSLDPTADQELELGCKVGLDATKTLSKPNEIFERAKMPHSEVVEKVLKKHNIDYF
jgi:2,5-furandicarboxylate decarboxylase 1